MKTQEAPKIEERQIKTKEGFLEFQFVAHCQNDRNLLAAASKMRAALIATKASFKMMLNICADKDVLPHFEAMLKITEAVISETKGE